MAIFGYDNNDLLNPAKKGDVAGVKATLKARKEFTNAAGVELNGKDKDGSAALHLAVIAGSLDMVKALIEEEADINIRNGHGSTALALAVKMKLNDIMDYLILKKADINIPDDAGQTPARHAVDTENIIAVRKLVGLKADIEIADRWGVTPLFRSSSTKATEISLFLIEKGANVNTHNREYVYPAHNAAASGDLDVLKALADKGAELDVQTTDSNGWTPIQYALQNNRIAVVEFLLKKNVDLSKTNAKGQDTLTFAKSLQKPHLVKILEDHLKTRGIAVDNIESVAQNDNITAAPAAIAIDPAEPAPEWVLMGKGRVACIETIPALNRKLTSVFNIEAGERFMISENLKTSVETLSTPEKFGVIDPAIVTQARSEYERLMSRKKLVL